MHKINIDIETKDKEEVITYLEKFSADYTITFEDMGAYREDPDYSLLYVEASIDHDELEHKMWEDNVPYVGVVKA